MQGYQFAIGDQDSLWVLLLQVTFLWRVIESVPQFPACSSKGTKRSSFQNFHRTWFVSDKVISLLWHLPKNSKIANFDELKGIFEIKVTIRARISSVLQYLLDRSFFSESRSDALFWWQTVWTMHKCGGRAFIPFCIGNIPAIWYAGMCNNYDFTFYRNVSLRYGRFILICWFHCLELYLRG